MLSKLAIKDYCSWVTPASDYEKQQIDTWRITRKPYAKGYYVMSGMDGYILFHVSEKSLPITLLQERRKGRWHTWMLDDPPHWRAMQVFGEAAKGRVLQAGLGLGLITHVLARNPDVISVTVVERSPEVINLVGKYVEYASISILQGDFFDYIDDSSNNYDTVIMDLWVARGIEGKLDLLRREVIPAVQLVWARFPSAKVFVHGFFSVSDLNPVEATLPPGRSLAEIVKQLMQLERGKLLSRR